MSLDEVAEGAVGTGCGSGSVTRFWLPGLATMRPAGLTGVVAIAAGLEHSLALKSDATVVAWGDNYYGQSTVPARLAGVVAIVAGPFHSLALKSDGTVVAWGSDPAALTGVVAIAAGAEESFALRCPAARASPGGAQVPPSKQTLAPSAAPARGGRGKKAGTRGRKRASPGPKKRRHGSSDGEGCLEGWHAHRVRALEEHNRKFPVHLSLPE